MQERDRFLKKTSFIVFFFFVLVTKLVIADNTKLDLLNYNKNLKNSSFFFIQTDGETIEEGVIYFGEERIRADYKLPNKITIVLSKKRGMYINHELKEVQYFDANKTFVKIFLKVLDDSSFLENSDIKILNDSITMNNNFVVNDIYYMSQIIYENNPVQLRKIKIKEDNYYLEMGFFNHKKIQTPEKERFSLANPYLSN